MGACDIGEPCGAWGAAGGPVDKAGANLGVPPGLGQQGTRRYVGGISAAKS